MKDEAGEKRVQVAFAHLADNVDAGYMAASLVSGLPVKTVRSRVMSRFGTLQGLRDEYVVGEARGPEVRWRGCIVCGRRVQLEKNLYCCPTCRAKISVMG